ncbi:MAG: phosphoglycerate kinase [Gemmatimonadota bacterium]
MNKKSIRDLPDALLAGKRVLVRVDYNVPLENGRVADDTRIRETVPTIQYLLDRNACVILVSHLGRPKGKWRDELSLKPAANHLATLIPARIHFVKDIVGPEAKAAVDAVPAGEILVLENVRFLPGEETNDPLLSEALGAFGDVYVNDAFGSAHRAHASTAGVAEIVKKDGKPAVAGFLMEKELRFLGETLANPAKPFVAILGGSKISGKIDVIENLLPRVDFLLIGGAMANTFFRAMGLETGGSLVEDDRLDMARELMERAGRKLVLPVDVVVAAEARAGVRNWILDRDNVPPEAKIFDIGPKSGASFRDVIDKAKTILWNGPVGMFEIPEFAQGTDGVARAVADATENGATSIAGGGDTAAAIAAAGVAERITHISTGGGASLEFLEGKTLPGVAILDDAAS